MMRLMRSWPSAMAVRKVHSDHLVYTVSLLIEKATGYLEAGDTAQASSKSFQATKLALMEYTKKLELTTGVKILPPNNDNPWSYNHFNRFMRLLVKKVDPPVATTLVAGWEAAYKLHVKGWTQNGLSVEDVNFYLPFVLSFIRVIEKDMKVNVEMAKYVQETLFVFNPEEIAITIYEEAKEGKITQLLHNLRIRRDQLQELNSLYKHNYGQDLADVLINNKVAFKKMLYANDVLSDKQTQQL